MPWQAVLASPFALTPCAVLPCTQRAGESVRTQYVEGTQAILLHFTPHRLLEAVTMAVSKQHFLRKMLPRTVQF
jgi:hypothetical protein